MSAPAHQLPPEWDLTRDIVMILGQDATLMGQNFISQGLQRVLAICPEPIDPGPSVSGITVIRSEAELARWVKGLHSPAKNVRILKTQACTLTDDVVRQYTQVLQVTAQQQRDFLAPLFELSPLLANNGVQNFAEVAQNPMIGDLSESFKGVPLIIVGAGPSLEQNIEVLKKAQSKAIIIAVNRTLRSLQGAGIYPDFTIALEPRDVACQFEGINLEQIPGIILATTVHHSLYELPAQRFISYYNQTAIDCWMFDAEDQQHQALSLGTVSHSAFSLGLKWGCDPIIFVGQDLSFPGGRYYHKDGADGGTEAVFDEDTNKWQLTGYSQDLADTLKGKEQDSFEGISVPGYYGGQVQTSRVFDKYRSWFETMALQQNATRRLFNCTEGGAHIEGMVHKPLLEALNELPDRTVDVTRELSRPEVAQAVYQRHARMSTRIERIHHQLGAVAQLSRKCLQLIEKSWMRPDYLGRLKEAETALKAAAREVPVLSLATQEAIKEVLATSKQIKSTHDSLRLSKQLYTILHERAREMHQDAQVSYDQVKDWTSSHNTDT